MEFSIWGFAYALMLSAILLFNYSASPRQDKKLARND